MEVIFRDLLDVSVLIWVDDVLVFAPTAQELMRVMQEIFRRCKERRIMLSPEKSCLIAREVKWCGRIIRHNVYRYDTDLSQGIETLTKPTTAAELQKLLCASNWFRSQMPKYAEIISPLQAKLREAQQKAGSLKRTKLRRIKFSEWTAEEIDAWSAWKELVLTRVSLTFLDAEKTLVVHTDASDHHWGVVVTQIPKEDESKESKDMRHEPLAFLSGSFKGAELRWATVEKEGFAVFTACKRLRNCFLGNILYCLPTTEI